ncbi:MAG: hypothetical protein Q8L37_03265 [Candidatus Gottesmanbacteria bacterium]|nr:hypothetical protein [Candidatus Gottesmanbacteria bacterium]
MDESSPTPPPLPSDPSIPLPQIVPPPPTVPHPSKLLWFLAGLAILILGILVGYAATNVLSQSKKPSDDATTSSQKSSTNFSQLTSSPTPLPDGASAKEGAPTLATGADLFAQWITYTNDKHKFSFTYPQELSYLNDYLDKNTQIYGNLLLQNFDGSKPRKELTSDFQMGIWLNKDDGTPLANHPKQWEKELGKLPIEYITVGGINAIKGFSEQKYQAVPTVWFSKNDDSYMIQLSHPNSTNKIWFDQILSTFKFTE